MGKKNKKKKIVEEEEEEEEHELVDEEEDSELLRQQQQRSSTMIRLKGKITEWLDNDDKIKTLNAKLKQMKDDKKKNEDVIMKIIDRLGMEDRKIDVHDDNQNVRARVYRYKSVTKGSLKEDIIKNALMEVIRDEKRVDQLVKKIESKRPINEKYYLKRTKGNK